MKSHSLVRIISALMFPPSFSSSLLHFFLAKIQTENGSISIFNKGNWRRERQPQKCWRRGWEQIRWQSRLPFGPESSGWAQGKVNKRSRSLRRDFQAGIIGALSPSTQRWEVGNCGVGQRLAQLDTEAQHCEMFSNLSHFLSSWNKPLFVRYWQKSWSWLASSLLFFLLSLCSVGRENK